MLNLILGALAVLSLGLLLWQFAVCMRFPLHRRIANPAFAPDISVLKPLKGADAETRGCLESWFTQQYGGRVQILFGVHAPDDPVCDIVRQLIASHPGIDAQLVVCPKMLGANAKVSTLVQLQREAKYAVIAVSDADVWVPGDFLNQCAAPLANNSVALVNCFYRLTNQRTLAMRCEAFAVNGDFWGQVLQARSLKPLDFALGAVMLTSQSSLKKIGAFESLLDHLADDYQLGNRLARSGGQIVISPVVVECRSETSRALHVWQHQLRWARTIRVSQPVPFFFSILNDALLWACLWVICFPTALSQTAAAVSVAVRWTTAILMERRLTGRTDFSSPAAAMICDFLRPAVWALSFLGNGVVWRGAKYRVERGGKLRRCG